MKQAAHALHFGYLKLYSSWQPVCKRMTATGRGPAWREDTPPATAPPASQVHPGCAAIAGTPMPAVPVVTAGGHQADMQG